MLTSTMFEFLAVLLLFGKNYCHCFPSGNFRVPAYLSARRPPSSISSKYSHSLDDDSNCHTTLCAGCGFYPVRNDINYYAEFTVPPLPKNFSSEQTYYIYFNIFFNNANGGKFNQFVPQLMLGSALTNSTGYPNYNPVFTQLNKWYISSQYFFALIKNNSNSNSNSNSNISHPDADTDPAHYDDHHDNNDGDYGNDDNDYNYNGDDDNDSYDFISKAACGELINVNEGDIVYTKFIYDTSKNISYPTWRLLTGIKNSAKVSIVETNKPYMGYLDNIENNGYLSWNNVKFNKTFIGACWELYNIESRYYYPNYMNYTFNISVVDSNVDHYNRVKSNVTDSNNFWKQWFMNETPNCTYSPKWTLNSSVNSQKTQQIAKWDIFYDSYHE